MGKTMRYVAFFKPYGILSQFTGESGATLSGFGLPPHLYAAGRLDKDSEGLLLLSNDGEFINHLLAPEKSHPRTYWVQVEGEPEREILKVLCAGVFIGDYKTKKARIKLLSFTPPVGPRNPPVRFRKSIPTAWLEITLYEGKNRQVRRMTAAIGFPTLRLFRVKIGNLSLVTETTEIEEEIVETGEREKRGNGLKLILKAGEWKDVKKEEIL